MLGITLSPPQAELATQRAAAAGLGDKVAFQVRDYRDLPADEFDAVSSIGMVEHVGSRNIDAYIANILRVLKPGGRLLNHGIARVRHGDPEAGRFSERYVFPDGAPLHLSRVILAIERAQYVIDHVEGLHGQYERTLRPGGRRLESDVAAACDLVGAERVRVWQLYLRAARNGFETRFLSTFQVRRTSRSSAVHRGRTTSARRTPAETASPFPASRTIDVCGFVAVLRHMAVLGCAVRIVAMPDGRARQRLPR